MDLRRSINTKVWSDDWFESLSPSEKLVWIYLLTNPQTNMLGIYEVSLKRICFDTGLTLSQISNALKGFERVQKAFYWFGMIFLPNWMKNQSMNPNMMKSAKSDFNKLPNNIKTKLLENGIEAFESLLNGYQILSKNEIEIEVEIETEKEGEGENEIITSPEEIETMKYLNSEYPKFFKATRPLTYESHRKLTERYGKNEVKRIYDTMHCKADFNKRYDEPYKVALNWLKKDNPSL